MSRVRVIVWLLVGIATAVAAHLTVDMSTDRAPYALRKPALVPLAEEATAISIECAGEPATRLQRNADGSWAIVAPYSAKADERAVLRLVDALAFSPITDEMTEAELLRIGRTRAAFGMDRPHVKIVVDGNGGRRHAVSLGSFTPMGDGVFAVVDAADIMYVVSSNVFKAASCGTRGFRQRRICPFGMENVAAFDIKGGAGRFSRLVRIGESWNLVEPHAGMASTSRVRAFLDAVTGLEAQTFVWPTGASNETEVASASLLAGYGLDSESSVTVTLKCLDGRDDAIQFGRNSDNGRVYALVQEGRAIVTVSDGAKRMAVANAFVDSRLLPVEAASIRAFTLDDGSVPHSLARHADGTWRLDAPVSAPADSAVVEKILGRMLALKRSDVAADGVRIVIGTNAAPVVVSRPSILADVRLEDLRAKEILSVDPKRLKRLVVTDAGKKPLAVLFDAEKGAWTVESAEASMAVDVEAVARLCAALHPLKALRIARLKVSISDLGAYGLDNPFRTVAIDLADANSVRRNILVGDVTDGGRFAALGSSDAVFVIPSESVAALLTPIAK